MALTIGGNSYITVEEFLNFANARVYKAWLADIATEDIEQYIVTAFDHFQTLHFHPDTPPIVEATPTAWMKEAQCFETIAAILLYADEDFRQRLSLQLQGVSKFQYDKQIEEYQKVKPQGGVYSREAFARVKPYLWRFPVKVVHTL